MKNNFITTLLSFNFILFTYYTFAQSVGINATGSAPDNSALLDLSATDKGFLITRVDTANIPSPAFGLMTLAPSDSCLYIYSGINWISLGGVGQNCPCNTSTPVTPPTSIFPCNGTVIPIIDVTNATTGKTWMDRNLGAEQLATSSADAQAYGDLYQWGRCSDGHEKRTSTTTTAQSPTDTPGHGDFITGIADWRSSQNNNLWQGVNGINNPCPTGYRIPTSAELNAEQLSWSSNNPAGAFGSPLKLPAAGARYNITDMITFLANGYWSSTISGTQALAMTFNTLNNGTTIANDRAYGRSVRCIKD